MKKRKFKIALLFCLPVVAILTLAIFLVNGLASGYVSALNGNGGGFFIGPSSTMTIGSGMTIKGSSATNGGGVYVSSGGTLNMSGGTVSENIASENGNNIFNAGTFTMTGGTIESISRNKPTRVDASGNPSSTGGYVLFGSYPQTHQTDTSVITSTKDSNGYYLGTDGNRYAKMVATIDNKFQDGTTVTKGSTYYFKVEPIKWRILSSTSGTLMLLCDQIMDSKWWDDDVSYTNSYVSSEIRAFLNGYSTSYGSSYLNNGFLQNAFTEKEQNYIQTTTVDNSVSTMNEPDVLTSEANTNDKIFLLSYKDLINTSYGFPSHENSDSSRELLATDFARAVGSYANGDYTAGSVWWSRSRAYYSAGNNSTQYATSMTYKGLVIFMTVNSVYGVVPVLNLSTSAFDMEEYGIYNTGTMNLYGGTINDNVYSSTSFNTKMNATINGTITLGDSATITVKDYAGTTPTLNIVVSSSRANGTILTLQGSSTAPDLTKLNITGFDTSTKKISTAQNSSGEWEILLTQSSYKVTLTFGGGIYSLGGEATYTVGSTVSIEATPYSGYSFSYWSGFPSDIEFVSGYSKYSSYCRFIMPEKALSLTAYGTPNTYTITLNNQSATTTGTSTIYEKYATGYYSNSSATTSITSITVPTKTCYTFGGYYTSTSGSGTQIINSSGSILASNTYFTSSTTLYAYWIPNVYTITLNNQSATTTGTSTIYEKYATGYYSNSSATTSITSITTPTKTGYTFGGYYTSTGGSGTQIINSSGSISASNTYFTSSTTLYAKWTESVYTITLNNQNALTSGTSTIYEKYATGYYSNSSATTSISSITTPTNIGYTFGGYYTSTGGSGTQIITSTGSISASDTYFTSSTTLYAKWVPNVYTITLNNQSATTTGTSTIYEKYATGYYSNSSATTSITSITVPTKTGYIFGGYYTSTGGSGTQIITSTGSIYASNTNFTSNTTVYACWVAITTYKITLNNQSATTSGTLNIFEGYGVGWFADSTATLSISSITVPTKSGYTFGGYYTSTGGSGTQIINSSGSIVASNTKFTSATTIYAKWTSTSSTIYTITLNNQSATTAGTSTIYEKYGVGYYSNSTATSSITSITVPTKSGYTFGGYYTSTGGSGTRIINSSGSILASNTYFTSTRTIYAYWIEDVELDNETFEFYLDGWLDNIEDYFNGEDGYSMSDVKTFAFVSPYGGNSMYNNYINHINTNIMHNVGNGVYFGYCEDNDAYSADVIYCIYSSSDFGFNVSEYVNTTFLMKFENLEIVDFSGLGVSSPCSFRLPHNVSQVYTNPADKIGCVKHMFSDDGSFCIYDHEGNIIANGNDVLSYIPNADLYVISNLDSSVISNIENLISNYSGALSGIVFASMLCPEIYENYTIEPIYAIDDDLYFALFTPTWKFDEQFGYDYSNPTFCGFYTDYKVLILDFEGFVNGSTLSESFEVSDFRGIGYSDIYPDSYQSIDPDSYPEIFGTDLVIGSQFANVYAGNLVEYSEGLSVLSLNLQSADPVSVNLEINNQIQAVLDDEKKRYFVLKEQNLDEDLADDDKND